MHWLAKAGVISVILSWSPDLKKKDFGYHEVEIESDAAKKKGEFWQEYRIDSLTEQGVGNIPFY